MQGMRWSAAAALITLALASVASATEDKTLKFSKPTNESDTTVTVYVNPGEDVPVNIPPNTSAVGKRNIIRDALVVNGYDVNAP